jgi:hypothetical protein
MPGKIRLGIIVRRYEIFLWEYRVLEEILNSGFAEIGLLIVVNEDTARPGNPGTPLFYKIHEKLDHAFYKRKFDYDEKRNILSLLEGIQTVSFNPLKKETGEKGSDDVISRIRNYNLEIILTFADPVLAGTLLNVSGYGILSYNIGDSRIIRGFSDGYREVIKKLPETGVELRISGNDFGENTVIYRTGLITHNNSLNVNRNQLYSLASLIIPRAIKGICLYGKTYLDRSVNKYNPDLEIFSDKLSGYPSAFESFKNLLVVFNRAVFNKFQPADKGRWTLYFLAGRKKHPFQIDFNAFKELKATNDRYWADPFVISKDNFHYIFIEEFVYKNGKGHISVLKLDNTGKMLSSERIIEKPYHMSYPFVFELNGNFFMIPETRGNKTIELYKCIKFPDKWEIEMNLMDNISASDSTLLFHDKKWWLFTSVNETGNETNSFNELFLYYSDDLFSKTWKSHSDNPIITDIRSSRQAGRIFKYGDKIFRPAQDCSGRYGRAFNINRISLLTTDEYQENLVSVHAPDWDKKLKGMHTFNFNDEIIVVDAFKIS